MPVNNYDICINTGGVVDYDIALNAAPIFSIAMRNSVIDADVICMAATWQYRLLGSIDPHIIGEIDHFTMNDLDFVNIDEGW